MSDHSLTEGQRRKIEENKKKALAIRAKRLSSCAPECVAKRPVHESISVNNTNFISDNLEPVKSGCQISQKFIKSSTFSSSNTPGLPHSSHQSISSYKGNSLLTNKSVKPSPQHNIPCNSSGFQHSNTSNSQPATVAKEKFYGFPEKVVKGKCVLVSKDRFSVDVPYHGPLIKYFKEMETRSYDTASRMWSFLLREYDKFMKGVKNFQPDIFIEPLPPIIIQTFCQDVIDNGIEEVDLSKIDSGLVKTLMPFQKEGVYFAIHHSGRILLADDMGLGKTLQALSIASYYRSEWPLLIVAPSSVRFDWAQQICKWLPSVDPQEVNVLDSGKGNVKECLVCIISYDLIHKKIVDLKERHFKVIIMDESHFLKNSKAIRTKAAATISKLAKRVILLSGTPALSRPIELFTQISAVCPTMFKFHDFGLRYCAAKQQPWGWDYSGSSNLQELQLLLEKKIMIRRQKSDVLQQLPDKTRQVVVLNPVLVSFNKDLNKACKMMDKASLKGMERRGALLQYFHETSKAKMKAVKDFILDLIESDKKFLVFAHHKEMMDCIEDAMLEHTKIKHIRIDGSTKSEQRSLLCKKFQTQDDFRVALLSITAANAGLNLAAANLVVFAELFWNPGILVQAEDRVHRIGQKNSVSVQYLVARKTADDFIWPLVQDKLAILTKAGLSKDCFSDADTKHLMDTKQSTILEMFKRDFIEESLPELFEIHHGETGSQSSSCPVTPTKLKRHRSSSQSPSSKSTLSSSQESPRKKQLRISQFLRKCDEQGGGSASAKTHNVEERDSPSKQCLSLCDKDDSVHHKQSCDNDLSAVDDKKRQAFSAESKHSENTHVLSMEDCNALNDVSWDEEFWT